jgi:asparagine synthase (glutamine-hydrolysing)
MCGIVAALGLNSNQINLNEMRESLRRVAYRGPDEFSIAINDNIALGHVRLSIVDIIGGQQPLQGDQGYLWLIGNGEIYNYKELRSSLEKKGINFMTNSDMEVILHLYQLEGTDCLAKLDGMFAFVLIDLRRGCLFSARDRLGIKPLFFHVSKKAILIASEIKSLFAFEQVRVSINPEVMSQVLVFGYPLPEYSMFEGINPLYPGHFLKVDITSGQLVNEKYWCSYQAFYKGTDCSTHEDIERVFSTSVKRHLMGEVDYGIYLSGGIDSSAIATLVANNSSSMSTTALTLGFQDRHFDESSLARDYAEMLNLSLQVVEDQSWNLDDLRKVLFHIEVPQILTLDLSMQKLSAAAKELGCKYILCGDGADELFGGYNHFGIFTAKLHLENRLTDHEQHKHKLQNALAFFQYPEDYYETLNRIGFWDKGFKSQIETGLPWEPVWLANSLIVEKFLPGATNKLLGTDGVMQKKLSPVKQYLTSNTPLRNAIVVELTTRLSGWILHRSDRNSMANGIESRVPYLSNSMIDLVANLPEHELYTLMKPKHVLRRGLSKLVPNNVATRAKKAFNTPHKWLFESMEAREIMFSSNSYIAGQVDIGVVRALWDDTSNVYSHYPHSQTMHHSLQAQTLVGLFTTELLAQMDWSKRYDSFLLTPANKERIIELKPKLIG